MIAPGRRSLGRRSGAAILDEIGRNDVLLDIAQVSISGHPRAPCLLSYGASVTFAYVFIVT